MAINFYQNIDKLMELAYEKLEEKEFESCAVYARKIYDIDTVKGLKYYKDLYEKMGNIPCENDCLIRLHYETGEKDYLSMVCGNYLADELFDQVIKYDEIGITAFISEEDNLKSLLESNDLIDFFKNYQEEPQFKVASSNSKEKLLEDIKEAEDMINEGYADLAAEKLESKDFSKLGDEYDYYITVLSHAYLVNREMAKLEKFSLELVEKGIFLSQAYANFILIYSQNNDRKNLIKYLHKLIELGDTEESYDLNVPMLLIDTDLIEETYYFSKKIIGHNRFTERDLANKAILEYLLGLKDEYKKTIILGKNMFIDSPFISIVEKIVAKNIKVKTVREFLNYLNVYTEKHILELINELEASKDDDVIDKIVSDNEDFILFAAIMGYKNIMKLISEIALRQDIDCVSDLVDKILLCNQIPKVLKINFVVFNAMAVISGEMQFVFDGVFYSLNLNSPIIDAPDKFEFAYYDALAYLFTYSYKPVKCLKRIKKEVVKLYNDYKTKSKEIRMKTCREYICTYLFFKSVKDDETINDKKDVVKILTDQKKGYYNWLKLFTLGEN